MKMLGYIMDEKSFEIVPTLNRTMATIEVDENLYSKPVVFDSSISSNQITYTFDFKPNANTEFTFVSQYDEPKRSSPKRVLG